jgi:ABC-type lipoprotein release transport system permease subunit
MAWRNLWRNRRRTLLSAGSIAFAVALLAFAMAQQIGSYALMIDNATALMTGQLQIQRPGFLDEPRIERTLPDGAALRARVAAVPGVAAATERVQAFVLVAAGERSVAAQVLGVDPVREGAVSRLPVLLAAGRFLAAPTNGHDDRSNVAEAGAPPAEPVPVELVVGVALARNLGVTLEDELVLLGTDPTGSVAALVGRVTGLLETGQAELDRGLLLAPLPALRAAFGLGEDAHSIVVRTETPEAVATVSEALDPLVSDALEILPWQRLLPELEQSIALDQVSNRFFYGLLALLVAFSIVNSFVMVVFERTREFGLLLALGQRPWRIVGLLELEALWLVLLGVAAGWLIALPVIAWVATVGLPLGESAGQMLRKFHMPDRMYTALDVRAFVKPAALMLAVTLIAALIPAQRVRRLTPVAALRHV